MTKAHLAANYAIGDPAEDMIEISDKSCICGGRLVPLLGKVLQSVTMSWDVWIEGNYEHVNKPEYVHVPQPIGEWNDDNSSTDHY